MTLERKTNFGAPQCQDTKKRPEKTGKKPVQNRFISIDLETSGWAVETHKKHSDAIAPGIKHTPQPEARWCCIVPQSHTRGVAVNIYHALHQ